MADRSFRSLTALSIGVLLSVLLSAAPAFAQNFEDGRAAAQQGDPATAIAIWTPLAEAGDPEAQYWLAESFWGGWWGVPENLERRAFWHMQAAGQGHVPSYVQLGRMYELGHHFAQDDLAAVEWYTRAAEAGNADGQYALAFFYQDGRGAAQDLERAHVLWETATLQGHEGARHELCERSGRFCNTCVADPQTFEIRQLRESDPMSFLEQQELMTASWAWDDNITIEGKTYRKSGLPQVRTFDVLEFFAFKDKVPFMIETGDGSEPSVIWALYKGMTCEVQPYWLVF
jgi:TPR repeat protein